MKVQLTLKDLLFIWICVGAFITIVLYGSYRNTQASINMTDYKGGQSECTKAYLNE